MSEIYKATTGEREYNIEFKNRERTQGTVNGRGFDWDIIKIKDRSFHVIQGNKSFNAEVVKADYQSKSLIIRINANKYEIEVKDRFDILLEKMGMSDLAADAVQDVKAPMPGMVLDVNVKPGQEVTKDEPIIVLEAMKMENVLKSPCDGVVKAVNAIQGKAVEKNAVLVEFE